MENKETPPSEARLKDSFLFANTIQFLRLFHQVLSIDLLTPSVAAPSHPHSSSSGTTVVEV